MLYATLKPIVGVALRWYYRSITVMGLERVPHHGPVFLAVNHPNALVDALVVGWCIPRQVHFTAKATIFANPVAARFFSAVGVVPLRRASDEHATPATGASSDAGSGETTAPDPTRNAAAFDAVARALAHDAAVVVFPEGKSHDDPHLAPLRTGLARMALHAAEVHGVRGIRIVPIGLLFEHKEAPRSRILLQVGEPLDVDTLRASQVGVATLTELVAQRLQAVTLNFDSPEDADRLQMVGKTVAALLEPPSPLGDSVVPLSRTLAVVRRLDRAAEALRARQDPALDERAAAFEARVRAFRARLDALHIDVHDLSIDAGARAGLRFALRETLLALLLVPIGLWGRLTHVIPIQLARRLAVRAGQPRDEPAMRTLVMGLVLVLLAYAVQTALVATLAGGWWALLFLLTLIPSASSDLRYGDRLRRARWRARAYRLFRRDPALQQQLRAEGDAIRRDAGLLEQAIVS
ncbi:lysophospholipid acyltransferase family protein [Gemmatimonas aurantiaca]|uniref:lysophospholipid acyltransferase family protein n=1 Tax=Gemmatimonas aurantiaca TaxID=173480 RepID=UPI00301E1872